MAIFTIQAPDGRKIKIEAADEATAIRGAQEWAAANPKGSPSPQFQDAMADASAMSQSLRQPTQQAAPLDLGTATAATINGIVDGIPVLGPMARDITDRAQAGVGALMGGDYKQGLADIQQRREQINAGAPISNIAGQVAGAAGSFGGLANAVGGEALGMGGKFLPGVLKSGLSQQGLYTADQHARGNTGLDSLGYGVPFLAGAGGRVIGDAVEKAGQGVADAMTKGAQRRMTASAVTGAPSSTDLKSAASQMFEASTGGKPLMVSDNAYFRFLGDVKAVADKFRINVDNDQQSVGLLNTLMRIADDTASGVRVDMKDLHLVRQLAADVAQSTKGRDKAFGSAVVRQMDDFIRALKPADILGGADPRTAANDLLMGISTWSRASKVATLEAAIQKGQIAASGPEKGIRNALRSIMNDQATWRTFNAAEQRAIRDVVEGTGGSNLLKLLGTFGFGGNSATNGIGGAAGMALGTMAGGPVGMVAGPVIGSMARKASEGMTTRLANRALAAAATPNLPIAKQMPNLLQGSSIPIQRLLRAGAFAAEN